MDELAGGSSWSVLESANPVSSSTSNSQSTKDVLEGHPVQIVTIDPGTHRMVLQKKELSRILLSDKCKDKPLVIVSISGDFRKGKSFLLNFMLRFLDSYEKNTWTHCMRDWLGKGKLEGFEWRGGMKQVTTGITMWSRPFIMSPKNGKGVAVLLMDTQGNFDSNSTIQTCASIFALSTSISSVQIFNVFHNLQEDDLGKVNLFSQYANAANDQESESEESKPFQKLTFLIRDWQNGWETGLGWKGGKIFLEKKFKNDAETFKNVRDRIRSCFESIDCFLMSHPGKKVTCDPTFRGEISDIDEDFLKDVRNFIEKLLSPSKLPIKKYRDQEITGFQMYETIISYAAKFNSDKLPVIADLFEANANGACQTALSNAKKHYIDNMESLSKEEYVRKDEYDPKQKEIKNQTLKMFDDHPKLGGKSFVKKFRDELLSFLDQKAEMYHERNQEKKRSLPDKLQHDFMNAPLPKQVVCVGLVAVSLPFSLIAGAVAFAACCVPSTQWI